MLRLMIIIALSTAVTKIAAAAPITYDFTGTVTVVTSFPGVSVGDKIAITLTLDSAFPDSDPSPNVGQYNTNQGTFESPLLDADFGGTGGNELFDGVTIDNNVSGVDAIHLGSGSPQTNGGFSMDFVASSPDVLTSDAIPLSIDPAAFITRTFTRRIAFEHSFFSGTIDAGSTTVPEPGTLMLLTAGLAGLAALRRHQRR
jgi:hypothetical protein